MFLPVHCGLILVSFPCLIKITKMSLMIMQSGPILFREKLIKVKKVAIHLIKPHPSFDIKCHDEFSFFLSFFVT